jgi:D-alanine transaminase/branched-chain amino acid aminotransferase
MFKEHAIMNGEIVKVADAVVNVTYREVQFSFSVYESISIVKGRAIFLEDHITRLFNSCVGIRLRHPFRRSEIKKSIIDLINVDEIESATMRILIIGGESSKLFITYTDKLTYPNSYYTEGVFATTYEGERLFPKYKTSNLLLSYIALEDAKSKGAFESILLNGDGFLLEGTRTNFYGFQNNKLFTANNEEALEGITRTRILEACKDLNIEVIMRAPMLKEIRQGKFDEIFISSTSMAAMPINRLDDTELYGDFSRTISLMKIIREKESFDR